MTEPLAQRRMAQNEVVFRDANRRIQESVDELHAISTEDGANPIHFNADMPLRFICECSDEECDNRIELTLNEYNKIHESPKRFVMSKKHDVPQIENIISRKSEYIVVEKHELPPDDGEGLKPTGIHNTIQ